MVLILFQMELVQLVKDVPEELGRPRGTLERGKKLLDNDKELLESAIRSEGNNVLRPLLFDL